MNGITVHSRLGRFIARLRRDERGLSAGTAIMFPALVIFVLAIFQFAFWYLGGDVAHSAAYTGYQQARAYQATNQDGTAAAQAALNANGNLLESTDISVDRTPTTVTVTVTGQAWHLLPFLPVPDINRSVTGPIERWVP